MSSRTSQESGQSTVELALAVPLLLIILLGLVDLGRAYGMAATLGNAAREAAVYAARNPTATTAEVAQHACDETGLVAYGSSCPPEFVVTCTPCPTNSADVTVDVSYRFSLVSWYLADRIFGTDALTVRAHSSFPGLSP